MSEKESKTSDLSTYLFWVKASLVLAPYEDGYAHDCESYISQIVGLVNHETIILEVFDPILSESMKADILKVMRPYVQDSEMRNVLFSWGIVHASLDIRDATIAAADHWEDRRFAGRLATYVDPDSQEWLEEYAVEVSKNLLENF